MDEAAQLGREHIRADYGVLVDEQSGQNAAFAGWIIGDLIGIALDPLAAVLGQVEALRGLQLQILTMNKLLSTLILSIGMSLSATAATSLLDSSIVGYSDFASQTADFGTLKDSVSITSDDSNLTLSGITFNGYGANNRDVMSVTMVLDLSKINTPDAYTALFNAKNSSVSWGVGLNTDRKLQGLWNNTSYSGPVVDTPLGTEGSLTISVVTGDLGTRIYFGDSTTYYSNSGLKFGNQQIDQILMDAGLAESIEQLYIHDSLLSQEQVGQLMSEIASIPEPATASLGLLGLAALMMRRRRA